MLEPGFTYNHPILGTMVYVDGLEWRKKHKLPSGKEISIISEPEADLDDDAGCIADLDRVAKLLPWALENQQAILDEAIRTVLLDSFQKQVKKNSQRRMDACSSEGSIEVGNSGFE
jgi:hypothetical protein